VSAIDVGKAVGFHYRREIKLQAQHHSFVQVIQRTFEKNKAIESTFSFLTDICLRSDGSINHPGPRK